MENGVWILGVFILTTSIFYIIFSMIMKKRQVQKRIDRFFGPTSYRQSEKGEVKKDPTLERISMAIAKIFKGVQFSKKTNALLFQAGSSMPPEQFLAYRLMSAISLSLLLFLLQQYWVIVVMGLVVGFLLPKLIMARRRKKRLQALPLQLIDTLGTMANSMRAGFSFMQVMQLVGKEMPAPIGPEFQRAVRNAGLGVPLEKVFEDMIYSLPNKELEVALEAIIAQRRSGGNLAELLETMEDTIRGRVRIMGELNTLTSQGKLSSLVITMLPIGLGFYLYVVDPDYFGPLIHEPIGIAMLTMAGFLVLLGWFAIQKILRIEV
ncbi:type II secretion system F family protein [Rossellomorea vietnamensis]|uniref:type II secretion system F family protein n=1 Tax=Rossellomorea vietnamensis TaxID=218284 RepID=UPI001CC95BBB|nr:type II secretion system F family protein [Rossellomorea vietnamensis]MCA0150481.1 type II secretion system F family protein [Rossellomorea vietnamensis]